jgi:phosphatidylserine synthase 2
MTSPPPLIDVEVWLTQPHTLTFLVVMLAIVAQLTLFQSSVKSVQDDIRLGASATALCFLFYCSLMLQDGQLQRPHPVVWRLVHGVTLLYLLLVVFLLAQSSDAHTDQVLGLLLEPRAGTAELPRQVNEHVPCAVTLVNMLDRVDIFFVAHFVGWFVKALILRDWGLMWTCSLMFEVLEVTFQNAIPNFKECWWDRWLYDVFGCNLLGMVAGMWFAHWLGAKEFNWTGGSGKRRTMKRVALHFTPRVFPRRFDWHAFSSWKRFGVAFLVVFGVMLGELNGFFLKSALRIPTDSYVNVWRVVLMVPAIYAAVMELYAYAEDRTPRIGQTAWLVIALGVLEFLLAVKNFKMRKAFREDQLRFEPHVILAWLATMGLALVVAFAKILQAPSFVVKVLARTAPAPLLMVLLVDSWENAGGG